MFGLWDSTGPRGGLGAKFQRALVSEIIGYDAVAGVKTSSRIDPAAIEKRAGPVFRTEDGGWTLSADDAQKGSDGKPVLYKRNSKGQDVGYDPASKKAVPDQGRPSVLNHGNVTPDYDYVRNSNSQIQYETRLDDRGQEVGSDPAFAADSRYHGAQQTTHLVAGGLAAPAIPAWRGGGLRAQGRRRRTHRACRSGARGRVPWPGTTWTFALVATCSPRVHPCGSFSTVPETNRRSLRSTRTRHSFAE